MLKVLGILVLLVSLLPLLIGAGGAIFVFALMGKPPICKLADDRFRDAEEAVKKYQAAKGTPREADAQRDADSAMKLAKSASDSCADANAYYRRNGIICAVVAFIGLIGTVLGAVLTIVGFRSKKLA
jgi:hypothetical protein